MRGILIFLMLINLKYNSAQVAGGTCTSAEDLSGVTKDCTKYLRCIYGKFYELSCPSGTNFDCVKKACNTPDAAVCAVLPKTTTTTTTRQTCTAENDLSGVRGDCSKYNRCIYGFLYTFSCPVGTNYDYIQKACNTPTSCKCFDGQTTVVTVASTTIAGVTTTVPPTTTTTTTVATTTGAVTSCQPLACRYGFTFDAATCRCTCGTGFSGSLCETYNCATSPVPDNAQVCPILTCGDASADGTCPFKCLCGASTAPPTTTTTTSCTPVNCKYGFTYDTAKCACSCGNGFSGSLCETYNCNLSPIPDNAAVCPILTCGDASVDGTCPFKCLCSSS